MKIFTGKVVSTKMKNTATVLVDSDLMHKLYGKKFIRSKKYHVHDEYGTKIGETVYFSASKPYSKLKKWKIVNYKGEGGKKDKVIKENSETNKEKSSGTKSIKR